MYEAIVIGSSAGSMHALAKILPQLPEDFPVPIVCVLHQAKDVDDFLIES